MDAEKILRNTIQRCKERDIIIPTYKQMANPDLIPTGIQSELSNIGLWDLNPRNLFRLTWQNEPVPSGGGFGSVNFLELPPELTGVKARIMVLIGKFFPTGAHKVGATFGPLVEKLISGQFDPTRQKALWPSTGNYCRGGAYDGYLLGCPSIAVLPEEMSRERYEWLEKVGAEIIRTEGGEANVKEIYDKVKALEEERGDEIVTLNQFSEIGNALWHYTVTGPAMEKVFNQTNHGPMRLSGMFLTQGSAGTLGSADYLRTRYPALKVGAGEALQVPTLLMNGYGAHRIEGIGDKHVPWIHNMKNMDMVIGIDDNISMNLIRLFNEPQGHALLKNHGVDPGLIKNLEWLGISSIANIAGAIKMAKYYEYNEHDMIFTVATDSMEMYGSRLTELRQQRGDYSEIQANIDFERYVQALDSEGVLELTYRDKKRMHNLKYFTWVEQQNKSVEELDAQWYDETYWSSKFHLADEWDERIEAFNAETGLLKKYA